MRPNKALAALFEVMAQGAASGEVQGAFVVFLCNDGSYDSCYETEDLGDLLVQVRTEVIRAQLPVDVIEQAERPN